MPKKQKNGLLSVGETPKIEKNILSEMREREENISDEGMRERDISSKARESEKDISSVGISERDISSGARESERDISSERMRESRISDLLSVGASERRTNPLPVVMCIGSDRVSGDLLGPAVGKLLVEEYNLRAYVYGVTGRNINGANIDFYDGFIREVHKDSKVVAVDACLGSSREIGKIKVGNSGVGAGHAVRKSGKRYGDIGVVGIVAENAEDNVMQLISVEVAAVEELSGRIAEYLAANLERLVEN